MPLFDLIFLNIARSKYAFAVVFLLGWFLSATVTAQSLPDSLVIVKNTYRINNWTNETDSLYKTQQVTFRLSSDKYESDQIIVENTLISDLVKELHDLNNLNFSLNRFHLDTNWIVQNPQKLLEIATKQKGFFWNQQQKSFITKELSKVNYYKKGLEEYLAQGCCYSMHEWYKTEFVLKFFNGSKIVDQITSRRHVWGYHFPWRDLNGGNLYSFNLDNIVDSLLNLHRNIKAPLDGKALLKLLANNIIKKNFEMLHRLELYNYEKEINELKDTFTIISGDDFYGYGGYNGDPKIKIVLKTQQMLPNVYLEFLASKVGKTIYSRDSVKKNYKTLVDRIQNVKFITEYLKSNPRDSLNILYFNNQTINQYNIDGVNKSPLEWKQHDEYLKTVDWERKNLNIKPSYDTTEARRISERLYCGCNFRFNQDFISHAISFIIYDSERNFSRWFLLPDNTVLLYISEGKKILNYKYSDFGPYPGLQYPCVRFDANGRIIARPK